MTTTPAVLVEMQDIPSSQTVMYPGNSQTKGYYIDNITATNYSAAIVTVNLWLVPPSGSAGNSNKITASKNLAANETYTFPGIAGKFQSPTAQIVAQASAANSVNIGISGRLIT